MIESILHFVEIYFMPLGAVGVFLAALVEEVVAPIPSAGVMMASGFLFLKGGWSAGLFTTLFFTVALPISLGVTVGSLLVFGIAYSSGKPAIERWGKWFGLTWREIERAQKNFERGYRDELLVFVLRVVPIVPSVAIAAYCGLVRMNVRTYLVFTFLGTVVRASALALLGWKLGGLYAAYAETIDAIGDRVLLVLIVAAVAFIAYRAFRAYRGRRAGRSEAL